MRSNPSQRAFLKAERASIHLSSPDVVEIRDPENAAFSRRPGVSFFARAGVAADAWTMVLPRGPIRPVARTILIRVRRGV